MHALLSTCWEGKVGSEDDVAAGRLGLRWVCGLEMEASWRSNGFDVASPSHSIETYDAHQCHDGNSGSEEVVDRGLEITEIDVDVRDLRLEAQRAEAAECKPRFVCVIRDQAVQNGWCDLGYDAEVTTSQ